MEPDFKEFEEYITEVQKYRKKTFDIISNKYTNSGSQDFLIDMKTLNVISFKDAKVRMPYYGTLSNYFCEPAHKMLEEISSCKEKVKTTSQKEPLEWGKDSGIDTDISLTAESSQESPTSSDEDFDFPFRGHDSKVSEKDLGISLKISKDSKVSEDLGSRLKIPICALAIKKSDSKEKGKVKGLDRSLKKSKRELAIKKFDSKEKGKVKGLDRSLKKSKRDLSFGRYDVFEKDFDSSLRKSKWGNTKPNVISTRRSPAFTRDTSFLQNIQVDDHLSISSSLSRSSKSINCSSK